MQKCLDCYRVFKATGGKSTVCPCCGKIQPTKDDLDDLDDLKVIEPFLEPESDPPQRSRSSPFYIPMIPPFNACNAYKDEDDDDPPARRQAHYGEPDPPVRPAWFGYGEPDPPVRPAWW